MNQRNRSRTTTLDNVTSLFYFLFVPGAGRASGWLGVATDRAPFFPTDLTAKKWLSVETPFNTVSPGLSTNSSTFQRDSVVSLHKISKPARSESPSAFHETFASGVTAPFNLTSVGCAGAIDNCRSASALSRATFPINVKFKYFS